MRRGAVEPEFSAGDVLLPGYRAVALLAHGRRLDTWDAYDEHRHVRCVVKLLRADRRHEQEVREAVLREGHLASTLAHPHLVRGYDVTDEPVPALVLETLPGATLAAVIEDQPLDVPDAALLGIQLASVLGYLHHHDWLHLDVKPANIVVAGGRAVLIDLSLAARPGSGRAGGGTPGYLAPRTGTGPGPVPGERRLGPGGHPAGEPHRRSAVRRRGHVGESATVAARAPTHAPDSGGSTPEPPGCAAGAAAIVCGAGPG